MLINICIKKVRFQIAHNKKNFAAHILLNQQRRIKQFATSAMCVRNRKKIYQNLVTVTHHALQFSYAIFSLSQIINLMRSCNLFNIIKWKSTWEEKNINKDMMPRLFRAMAAAAAISLNISYVHL